MCKDFQKPPQGKIPHTGKIPKSSAIEHSEVPVVECLSSTAGLSIATTAFGVGEELLSFIGGCAAILGRRECDPANLGYFSFRSAGLL